MRPYIWCHDRWPNLYHYEVTVTVRKSSVPNPGWQFRTFFFCKKQLFGISSGTTNIFISNPTLNDDPLAFYNLTRTQHENFQRPPNVFMQPEPYLHKCQYLVQSVRNPNQPPCINLPIPITEAFHSTNYVLFSMGMRRAPLRGELRHFHRVFLPFCTIFSYSL